MFGCFSIPFDFGLFVFVGLAFGAVDLLTNLGALRVFEDISVVNELLLRISSSEWDISSLSSDTSPDVSDGVDDEVEIVDDNGDVLDLTDGLWKSLLYSSWWIFLLL